MTATATRSVYEALAAVMDDVGAVAKTGRNLQQGYNFRGIDAIVNAVGPALRRHRVIVVPEVQTCEYTTVEVGTKRTLMGHVRVVVSYTFYGPGGDSIRATTPGEAMDSGDKATPKAMSVAFRTALLQALALPTDEADPDSHSYERSEAPPAPPPPTLDELLLDAEHANSHDALSALARRAVAAHGAGRLSDDDLVQVRDVVTARRAELPPKETAA